MALNGNDLGDAITAIENEYNEVNIADLPQARAEMNRRKYSALIAHFTTNGEIPAIGLNAPNGPVTGSAKIT